MKLEYARFAKTEYRGYPAISRRDNRTEICENCGMIEALQDYNNFREKESKAMTIKIERDERFGYTVLFNDEVILECISGKDLKTATIKDLIDFAKDAGII